MRLSVCRISSAVLSDHIKLFTLLPAAGRTKNSRTAARVRWFENGGDPATMREKP
jgi:hypothetical protein